VRVQPTRWLRGAVGSPRGSSTVQSTGSAGVWAIGRPDRTECAAGPSVGRRAKRTAQAISTLSAIETVDEPEIGRGGHHGVGIRSNIVPQEGRLRRLPVCAAHGAGGPGRATRLRLGLRAREHHYRAYDLSPSPDPDVSYTPAAPSASSRHRGGVIVLALARTRCGWGRADRDCRHPLQRPLRSSGFGRGAATRGDTRGSACHGGGAAALRGGGQLIGRQGAGRRTCSTGGRRVLKDPADVDPAPPDLRIPSGRFYARR